uniref:Uncharacterized protein n=1 Tax=Photinus pyralis TaxID=7054 RepID=A0A1Y1KCZ1_PHOPY
MISNMLKEDPEIKCLTKTINESVHAAIKVETEKWKAELNALKEELKLREREIDALNRKLDRQQQYSRRHCILMFGIPEVERENTDLTVLDTLTKTMKVNLELNAIRRSHRTGRTDKDKPRPIIVKFASYGDKQKVLHNAKLLKGSQIFVSEDLTSVRLAILKEALARFKRGNVWSRGGMIFIKDNGNVFKVESMSDLCKISVTQSVC